MITGQLAQVILGRGQPRRPRRRRAEAELEPSGPVRCVEPVQQPDVARAVIHDPLAVGTGIARVPAVVVGMPPQVAAVQRAGVQVACALVVRQERQPAAGQHGAGELARQAGEYSGEPRRRLAGFRAVRARPQPSRRSAPVSLPERRIAVSRRQQRDPGRLDGQVRHLAERQPLATGRRAVTPWLRGGQRVGPGEVAEGLARGGNRDDLAVRRPAADPGGLVGPVAEPAAVPAVDPGQVDLGRAVPAAGPGDQRAVPGDPGVARRRVVGRDPPGPAAGGRGEPYIVFGDEGDDVAVDVREAEVAG